MFSDAISSISCRWRPSSPLIAAAISGSASASVAVKNESGAEAVLELEDEEVIGEISPPPQALRGKAVGYVWRSKEVPARYHISRNWPSTCGIRLIFMQDMVGMKGFQGGRPRPRCPENPSPSCTGLSRASTSFLAEAKTWMAGTSPAMTA